MYYYKMYGGLRWATMPPEGVDYIEIDSANIPEEPTEGTHVLDIDFETRQLFWKEVYMPQVEEKPDETTLMKAQIQAQADRQDFLEDCIAEMAGVIYA